MVKVSGGARTLSGVQAHLAYIGRDGELGVEVDHGVQLAGKGFEKQLVPDWDLDLLAHRRQDERSILGKRRSPKLGFMLVLNIALLFLTLVVAPLVAWKQTRCASVLLGVVLFLCQADMLFFAMGSAGRGIANQEILSKGNAGEVTSALTALTALKDAQWPMRLSVLLAGAGL